MFTSFLGLFVVVAFAAPLNVYAGPVNDPSSPDPGYVGFIWHYPFVDAGSDQISDSGANAMMARCNWGTVQPAEDSFDFSSIKRQIEIANQEGVKLVLLLEFNPICSPEWLKKKCFAAGEGTAGFSGQPGSMPQIGSRIFRKAQEEMVRRLASFLTIHDTSRTVTHYMPGIEWWFPQSDQYSLADQTDFRHWLTGKYHDITQLNLAWGGHYSLFTDVPAPGVEIGDLFQKERQGLAQVTYSYPANNASIPHPTHTIAAANDWTGYWNETAAKYINSMGSIVKEIDPSRPRASFITFSWAQSAEWDYVNWSQVRLDSVAKASDDLDILGMQLCFTSGDSFRLTAGLDLARKYGKPMWDMDLLDFVKGVSGGLESHVKNTHAAVQHGAKSLFYCCWNGAKDFNFFPDWPMTDIKHMIQDARQALDIVRGATIEVEGAILNPIVCSVPEDPPFGRNDVRSFMGWYKILERVPTTVDVITLREIEQGCSQLNKYRWILVPDCPYLSTDAFARLSEYAAGGGFLIRGGRFADFDENGEPLKATVAPGNLLPDYGLQYAGSDLPRRVFAGDTPPQMIWRPETGQTKAILASALQSLKESEGPIALSKTFSIEPQGKDLRCTVFHGPGYHLVYLLNMEFAMVRDINLTLKAPYQRITRIHVDMQENDSLAQHIPDQSYTLPEFKTTCIVRIESTNPMSE